MGDDEQPVKLTPEQEWWERSWQVRETALDTALGELDPPGKVIAVPELAETWPGYCVRRYRPAGPDDGLRIYCTLGPSQPARPGAPGRALELTLEVQDAKGDWPASVLLAFENMLKQGYQPRPFNACHTYETPEGLIVLGAPFSKAHAAAGNKRLGTTGGALFAPRAEGLVEIPGGEPLRLFALTLLHGDDEQLLDEEHSSPAAVLLLIDRLGLGRTSALDRSPLLQHPGAKKLWAEVLALSEDQALAELGLA
jgi:hypothetical protein